MGLRQHDVLLLELQVVASKPVGGSPHHQHGQELIIAESAENGGDLDAGNRGRGGAPTGVGHGNGCVSDRADDTQREAATVDADEEILAQIQDLKRRILKETQTAADLLEEFKYELD